MGGRITWISAAVIVVIITALAYGEISSGRHAPGHSQNGADDALEDAIIIYGLRMDSESPMEEADEGPAPGSIIFNDEFDGAAGLKEPPVKKKALTIDELRRKDRRWHIARYRIRRDDNLWSIAKRYNTDYRLIIKLNGIDRPELLGLGRLILVPHRNGTTHVIKSGDTLASIAGRYGIKASRIASQNGIPVSSGTLMPGERIFIPDARPGRNIVSSGKPSVRRTGSDTESLKTAFRWPLRGRISSGFGNRRDPFSGSRRFHCGIDISADPGTPVRAAADGTVIFNGWKDGYGNMIVIRHENGYISVYAHNSENLAAEGSAVHKGDTIALSGMTGAVTGAHLHFELRRYLTPLNPSKMLRRL